MQSWCDKLASVPTVGLKLDPHFASGDAILDALSPIIDRYFVQNKNKFRLSLHQSFQINFDTDDGYVYAVDQNKISVGFKHRMRAKAVSGKPPTMEMLSEARPFTTLLPQVFERLTEATICLTRIKKRHIGRIGIVSSTVVSEEEAPPGLKRFVEYMARPWGKVIEDYSIQVMAEVGDGPASKDRCIHKVVKPEDKEELLEITLDWQRIFETEVPAEKKDLKDILEKAEKAALRYFEDVGEGARFDETVLQQSVRT